MHTDITFYRKIEIQIIWLVTEKISLIKLFYFDN